MGPDHRPALRGARPSEAPVATPLAWEELSGQDLTARRYTMQNLFRRLGQKEDPWARIDDEAVSLEAPQRRLRELRGA